MPCAHFRIGADGLDACQLKLVTCGTVKSGRILRKNFGLTHTVEDREDSGHVWPRTDCRARLSSTYNNYSLPRELMSSGAAASRVRQVCFTPKLVLLLVPVRCTWPERWPAYQGLIRLSCYACRDSAQGDHPS
jgi:hypothetical protein